MTRWPNTISRRFWDLSEQQDVAKVKKIINRLIRILLAFAYAFGNYYLLHALIHLLFCKNSGRKPWHWHQDIGRPSSFASLAVVIVILTS